MSEFPWSHYDKAYKAIHDKLNEILIKLDYPMDPAIQDVIDRADRLLGRIYGSQGQQLLQRATTYDFIVQLRNAGIEIDPRQIRSLTVSDIISVEQSDQTKLKATVTQAAKDRSITDVTKVATQKKIDLTATGVIHTPAAGKKLRVKAFAWSSNADIVTALRFGTTGDLLFPIQAKGVIGMNLVGCNIEGVVDEALYGYLSGTGTMKGTILVEEL